MKIGKLTVALVFVISSALIVSGIYYWSYLQNDSMPYKPIPLIEADVSPEDVTVVQGATFQVRITIFSRSDSELTIPLEEINLRFTNYTIYDLVPQEEMFSYRFIFHSLTLGPGTTKSSVLTVDLTENAPIGDFVMSVELGNDEVTHVSGPAFSLTITCP